MINGYIQQWLDVIENMSNDNTYKLAWGRAILETVGEKETESDLLISFDELSPKILKYYWNQIYFFNLTQSRGRKPYIEQKVNKMIDDFQRITGSKVPIWYEKAELLFKKDEENYNRLIKETSTILTRHVSWRFMCIRGEVITLYILDLKKRTVFFTREQVSVLKDYRFLLSQLLNYRWAQLLEMYNTAPKIASKVNGLSDNKIRRSNLRKYKEILLDAEDGDPIDFYTGKVLQENDISVDHVIPWSFIYSDDIWNLVLTSKSNNSSKSNTVPSAETINKLKQRNLELIEKIKNTNQERDLKEAVDNNYVDKFYNSMKM